MIDYEMIKQSEIIKVYSPKIADILIVESAGGSKNLRGIEYIKGKNHEGVEKVRKIFIFKNSDELFDLFRKYTEKVTEEVPTEQKENERV